MNPAVLSLVALLSLLSVEECREHLEAHSPSVDFIVEGNLSIIDENISLALWSRDSMPWGPSIPDSVFLRYVLPARVSQEPLVNWRRKFRDALLPVIEGAATIEDATILVSNWCDSILDYAPTQFRDQSPLVTWSSGIGRCEEMTVFFLDALRSIGIPCRQVYTPWWSTVDSNHAWPEVYTSEGWHFTDISAEVETPNSTWFTERAKYTALVVAIAADSVDAALKYYGDVSSLNVTGEYAPTGLLYCREALTSPVTVTVVNWGSYRPFAVLDSLHPEIALGGGVYLLTWGWPVSCLEVSIVPGDSTSFTLAQSSLPDHHIMNLREGE